MLRLYRLIKSDGDVSTAFIAVLCLSGALLLILIIFSVSTRKARAARKLARREQRMIKKQNKKIGKTAAKAKAEPAPEHRDSFPNTAELEAIRAKDENAASETLDIPPELILPDDPDDTAELSPPYPRGAEAKSRRTASKQTAC